MDKVDRTPVLRRPRIFLHDDHQYISIGFEGEPDTLLKVPDGWRDRDRTVEWCIAIKRLVDRNNAS